MKDALSTKDKVYQEAEKYTSPLSKLVEEVGISQSNYREWLLFCRTIKSSLVIIEEVARLAATRDQK